MRQENKSYPYIKQILKDRGISVSKCARQMDLNQPDLTNALNGKKPLYPAYRKKLSDFLGIDEAVLFPKENGGDDNE